MRSKICLLCLLCLSACNVSVDTPTADPVAKAGPVVLAPVQDPINGCDPAGNPFGGGSGHSDDPFLICSITQLKRSLGTGEYGELRTDLDLSAETAWPAPLLQGTLNGAGHELANLVYHGETVSAPAGIFSQVTGRLQNLRIRNVHVYIGAFQPAAIAVGKSSGYVENVEISNSQVSGSSSISKVGGVVGENLGNISQCYASFIAIAGQGGIAGSNTGLIEFSDAAPSAPASVNPPFDKTSRVVFGNSGTLSNCKHPDHAIGVGSAFSVNMGTLQTADCH